SGKLTSPGISNTLADTPALPSTPRLYSAMRLALAEPASREGISVVMCSTCALTLAAATAATTHCSDMPDPRYCGPHRSCGRLLGSSLVVFCGKVSPLSRASIERQGREPAAGPTLQTTSLCSALRHRH